jgi:very-short-patch-repair endonuclease
MPRNSILPYRSDLKIKSRELRKSPTVAENLLWLRIKKRAIMGYQFHRQVPVLNFIADFYCHEIKLIIEIDGDYHLNKKVVEYDQHREFRLTEFGLKFLRFTNDKVQTDMPGVLKSITDWIQSKGFVELPPHVRKSRNK